MKKQPIETAPKDGTWILLFGGTTEEIESYAIEKPQFMPRDIAVADILRPVVGRWDPEATLYEEAWDNGGSFVFGYWDSSWYSYYKNPTHWASLKEIEE